MTHTILGVYYTQYWLHYATTNSQLILWSLVSDEYFLGSHSFLNVWLCLRLLMSWRTPSSPTESSHRLKYSSDVLCCNMSDIEEAPSTPMALYSTYRCFRVEFLQSAAASFTAPSLLMSSKPNYFCQQILWSLVSDWYFSGSSSILNVWLCFRVSMSL